MGHLWACSFPRGLLDFASASRCIKQKPDWAQGFRWTKEVSIKGASALVVHFYEKSCTYDARLVSEPGGSGAWCPESHFHHFLPRCAVIFQHHVEHMGPGNLLCNVVTPYTKMSQAAAMLSNAW